MQDSELKEIAARDLPGSAGAGESRLGGSAGADGPAQGKPSPWAWIYLPSRRGLAMAVGIAVVRLSPAAISVIGLKPISLATADSQAPGIYATSFYSDSAQAQVVWLNGMEPATDKPTYLDPTTVIKANDSSAPAGDPNSL